MTDKNKELQKFGLLFFAVFGLLTLYGWYKGNDTAIVFSILSLSFLVLSFAKPSLLFPLHKYWIKLSFALGWVMTRVILSLLFFVVITPIGLIMRLTGKDPMHRKWDKNAETYWIKKDSYKGTRERWEKAY